MPCNEDTIPVTDGIGGPEIGRVIDIRESLAGIEVGALLASDKLVLLLDERSRAFEKIEELQQETPWPEPDPLEELQEQWAHKRELLAVLRT